MWVRETTHAGRIQVVHRAPLARLIRLTLFWKEQSFKLFLFLHRFSVTARWVVFAKKKTVEQFLKNKKKRPSHFKFALRGVREVYFKFFREDRISLEWFPPPWSEQCQMSLCETSLNAERKIVYFFPNAISSLWSACFQSFFSRMSLVLKHKIADKNKSIKILTKHVSQLNKVFLLKLTPLEVWNFYRFFIALWISERKLK